MLLSFSLYYLHKPFTILEILYRHLHHEIHLYYKIECFACCLVMYITLGEHTCLLYVIMSHMINLSYP
jgi:hypothetical protein